MIKPTPLKVSAPVRSGPVASLDKSREEKNYPPIAPPPEAVALHIDPIPLDVRRLRVEAGSRRQRDLAAISWAANLERDEEQQRAAAEIAAHASPTTRRDLCAFIAARRRLRRSLPNSSYRLWIKPLRPAGHIGEMLLLAAPQGIRAWTERRYEGLILEALEGTGFSAVSFAGGEG
jgi:DnaA-like protein